MDVSLEFAAGFAVAAVVFGVVNVVLLLIMIGAFNTLERCVRQALPEREERSRTPVIVVTGAAEGTTALAAYDGRDARLRGDL